MYLYGLSHPAVHKVVRKKKAPPLRAATLVMLIHKCINIHNPVIYIILKWALKSTLSIF